MAAPRIDIDPRMGGLFSCAVNSDCFTGAVDVIGLDTSKVDNFLLKFSAKTPKNYDPLTGEYELGLGEMLSGRNDSSKRIGYAIIRIFTKNIHEATENGRLQVANTANGLYSPLSVAMSTVFFHELVHLSFKQYRLLSENGQTIHPFSAYKGYKSERQEEAVTRQITSDAFLSRPELGGLLMVDWKP